MLKRKVSRIVFLAVLLPATSQANEGSVGTPQERTLCNALEEVQPGQLLPVSISGLYVEGLEDQVFYDPNQPVCDGNVQPVTWVEFAPDVVGWEALKLRLETDRRALVTLVGDLVGPGLVGPDTPGLPLNLAYANRVSNLRYGHLNGYRTKLLVHRVDSVRKAPVELPESVPWREPLRNQVLSAEMPLYPSLAYTAGISGTVIIEVSVADGEIARTEVKSGDRMLSGAAVSNVRTWKFEANTNTTFTTTFIFSLERRRREDEGSLIELRLPELVRITAARNEW